MRHIIKIILIVLISVIFLFTLWHNVDVFAADYYFKQAKRAEMYYTFPIVLGKYKNVLWHQPFEQFYQQQFALDLLRAVRDEIKDPQTKVDLLTVAIEQIKKIPTHDRVFETHVYLARMMSFKAALTQTDADFEQAEEIMAYVANLSPQMARVYNDWCQLKIYEKEWDNAEEMCARALALAPDIRHPQMNFDHQQLVKLEMREVYEKLGDIYKNRGDYQTAEDMYIQSLKMVPLGRPATWKKIGDLYYLQGDIETAIEKNIHGYHLNPTDPAWSRALMALYIEKGDIETAKIWQERARALGKDF